MKQECKVVAPVFKDYKEVLVRFIASRIQDPVDREDILSEVLLKIYDNCEKLEHVRKMEAWLIMVAKNTVMDYFRARKNSSDDIPDLAAELEEDGFIKDLEKCLPSLLDKLPAKYANPLIEYELKGISQRRLAENYGLSESGMKSRIQRSRKMLKELFVEYCGQEMAVAENCDDCKC